VRDRGPLISTDVRNPGLEEALGDGEDSLPAELLTIPKPELLDLGGE
jgi:hypothetical protein